MLKTLIKAAFALPGFAGAASALSIPPANCVESDGAEYWHAFRYGRDLVTVVIASPKMWEQELEQVAMVSCHSQQQVTATVPADGTSAFEVINIFETLIGDTATHTFADTVLHLAEAGFEAKTAFFDNDACLCDTYVLERMNSLDWIEDNQ